MTSTLTISCGEFPRTKPLLNGRVQLQGLNLEVVPDPFPANGMLAGGYQHTRNQRMIRDRAFDICEMGMAPYLSARAAGVPLIAIPVFHYRRFRHSYIFCRKGVDHPRDLVGCRVGIRRLDVSAAVWERALLQHEYGIPLERITWVVCIDTPLRPDVRVRLIVERAPNENLEELLVHGELDAIMEANNLLEFTEGNPMVRQLLGDNTTQLEVEYYARTGIFPIMHTVVLWKNLVARLPDLPEQLHQAFVEAKEIGAKDPDRPQRYVLAEEERQWWHSLTEKQKRTMQGGGTEPRNPWIYSAREDRKTVEIFLDYAYEQGLTPTRYKVEELFVESTLDL